MHRFSLPLFLCLALASSVVYADDKSEPIQAERPGFTNGTDITAPGRVQIETGFSLTDSQHQISRKYADGTQIRVPLRRDFEVRFGFEGYEIAEGRRGGNDTLLSVKYRVSTQSDGRTAVPAVALIAGLELPTGAKQFREDDYQPSTALEADWALSEKLTLTADVTYMGVRDSGTRYSEWGSGISLSADISELWGSFIEIYRISDTGMGDTHQSFFDTGATYRIGKDIILDVNGGVGIPHSGSEWFYGGGVATRW